MSEGAISPTGDHTVTFAKNAGTKPNPHGGELVKFYCTFTAGDQEFKDVYWQRKSDQDPTGQTVYGHIEAGQFGLRFFTDQQARGGGGGGGGNRNDPSVQRSIAMQSSQKVAAEYARLAHERGTLPEDFDFSAFLKLAHKLYDQVEEARNG
jgi:hypothetical protein